MNDLFSDKIHTTISIRDFYLIKTTDDDSIMLLCLGNDSLITSYEDIRKDHYLYTSYLYPKDCVIIYYDIKGIKNPIRKILDKEIEPRQRYHGFRIENGFGNALMTVSLQPELYDLENVIDDINESIKQHNSLKEFGLTK